MNSKATRLFLVRHAETEWNAAEIFQGRLDSALTARGLKQAAELAERLVSESIAAIYSSDQGRALRTAEIVGSKLGIAAVATPDLREIDCGEWTGRSYQEVRTQWPEHYADWRSNPERHRMPAGESVAQVQQRAVRFLDGVRKTHSGQAICAITHNTGVRTLLCYLRGWPLSRLWEGERQYNCAINLVELVNGQASLLDVSDTSHLSIPGAAGPSAIV